MGQRLFNPIGIFGANTIFGGLSPYHRSGYLAKITDGATLALPVTLLNPGKANGANFQFQFLSQAGFTHHVRAGPTSPRDSIGAPIPTITGDGNTKTGSVPFSVFSPAQQGFHPGLNALTPAT